MHTCKIAAHLFWLMVLAVAAGCTPPRDGLSKYPAPPPDQELATLMASGISTARPGYPPPIPGPLRGPNPTQLPTPSPDGMLPEAVQAAQYYLAGRLEESIAGIEVITWEEVEWASESLGCSPGAPPSSKTVTPGYRVLLQAGGLAYELHSTADGTSICLAQALYPGERIGLIQGTSAQDTANLARDHLSSRLGIPEREIRIQDIESFEWRDAALECSSRGITPTPFNRQTISGYRILLASGDQTHAYHSGGYWLVYCGTASVQ